MSIRALSDKKYHHISFFNIKTGYYYRSGVLDERGSEIGTDPFMASFPHLLDIGIMGQCIHGKTGACYLAGVQCYQGGPHKEEPNMELDDFRRIVDECKGRVFQFALGGRGDPDQHEKFSEILELCVVNNIVPNFTSSGFGFNERIVAQCKKHCGAVAVSWYRQEYTLRALKLLLKNGISSNVHYVLGKNTIEEAIYLLRNNKFPNGINAVIFLLHKPVGLGEASNVLDRDDPRTAEFFNLINAANYPYRIGFDSCSVPALINYCEAIDYRFVDTCEGGRFSCYISPDMRMTPCSFDQEGRWSVDLDSTSIQAAWESEIFNDFRKTMQSSCHSCLERDLCFGGCPIDERIVLCERKERTVSKRT
jgi:radical SAM protein with 4Fe4S-binding SPASM domain